MVSASVRRVTPSRESAMYATVQLAFTSTATRSIRVKAFRLVWPTGAHSTSCDLAIAPGETREWTLRVYPDSGDVGALDVVSACVEAIEIAR